MITSKKAPLTFLATVLLSAITEQASQALTLNFPVNLNPQKNAFVLYQDKDYYGFAWLKNPELISRDSLEKDELLGLLNVFALETPANWEFEFAENELQGTFQIITHYACAPQTPCGGELDEEEPFLNGVGSTLQLDYYPDLSSNDPIPDRITGDTVKWIQRVRNNHAIKSNPNPDKHGIFEDILDTNVGQSDPYYSGSQGEGKKSIFDLSLYPYKFFGDAPYRIDPQESHFWDAELYLAKEIIDRATATKKVTIYDGLSWGWRNATFRRDPSCPANLDAELDDFKQQIISELNRDNSAHLVSAFLDAFEDNKTILAQGQSCNSPLDIAFVFDTTDSMDGEIVPITNLALDIANELLSEIPDTRVAVTNYRDFPRSSFGGGFFGGGFFGGGFFGNSSGQGSSFSDYPYKAILPFSSDPSSITRVLSPSFFTTGGGDTPETAYTALINTIQGQGIGGWRDDAKKAIILFTDAPPHDPEPKTGYTASSVIDTAQNPLTIQTNPTSFSQNQNAVSSNLLPVASSATVANNRSTTSGFQFTALF